MKILNDIILSAESLTIGYGSKVILKDLELEIRRGNLVSFIGPNGIGKSTLIRTLAGIQDPIGGSINLEGIPIHSLSTPERAKKISMVLTEKVQAGNLTVEELVSMGRYPLTDWIGNLGETDLQKIKSAIDLTRINYIANRKIGELSDGQIQKTMIARAIAQDGDLIILDEPTAHLDINNRIEVMQVLKELAHDANKAVLVTTHDLDLALQASDLIWLANWNKPMVFGAPEDLILGDHLTDTFISDGFDFDKKSGRFQFRIDTHGEIGLEGDGLSYYWTKVALHRKGYQINQESESRVTIQNDQWVLQTSKGEQTFASIGELLENL